MKPSFPFPIYVLCLFLLASCGNKEPNQVPASAKKVAFKYGKNKNFKDYWYQGKAELNSYELSQARYGELREGEAVLIFVTEPFSKSKQVKLDNGNTKDAVSVLKCNFTRKFNTGLYPYSTMQSIFTPVELKAFPHSLKTSTSSQEWCGHTFMQLNLDGNKYKVTQNSYFESEGDKTYKVSNALLEDELFNRIRIDPGSLPSGSIEAIPSALFARLKHVDFRAYRAKANLAPYDAGKVMVYTIEYPELQRRLAIQFNKAFPHDILGWEEQMPSGYGGKLLTSTATRKASILLDYWNRNANSDAGWREKLKLD